MFIGHFALGFAAKRVTSKTSLGTLFAAAQLLDLVWHQDSDVYEHTVNSHINRLRGKVEQDPNRPELILTVWGVGYRFTDES
jgi:DNA-binding response OmpR family regulator